MHGRTEQLQYLEGRRNHGDLEASHFGSHSRWLRSTCSETDSSRVAQDDLLAAVADADAMIIRSDIVDQAERCRGVFYWAPKPRDFPAWLPNGHIIWQQDVCVLEYYVLERMFAYGLQVTAGFSS